MLFDGTVAALILDNKKGCRDYLDNPLFAQGTSR